jgi:SNF2 family DNA or RNA helicase
MVAVKHGIDEAKVLRNLGLNAPSPIRHYYKWSGQYTPFDAQRVTAEFLTMNSRAYVLNDIGTGKSLSTLWAYDYLRSIGKRNKMLVVAPMSTMEMTWGNEVFRHFTHLDYVVLHGDRKKRLKLLEQDADIYIINHDGLEIIASALKNRPDIDVVTVDELTQVARNASTDRWKALNTVVNKQSPRDVWGLTGLPIPNSPTEAWAQCKLITPETVPPYFNRYRDSVMRQVGMYNWVPRENALEVVKQAMKPAVRFSRDECVDLPPVMFETRSVPLTADQAKAYKDMLNTMRVEAENNEILAVNEAVKAGKLVQIACGVAYGTTGEEVSIPATPRLKVVNEIIDATEHKVIVFVPFVSAVEHVAASIRHHLGGSAEQVERIHGSVSKSERDRIFRSFQNGGECRVLVAQPAAMSHGLTLTAASTIVWYAPVNSNDTFVQANGRITRPGQKNNQYVIMLEGTTIERRMYERLKNRQKMQGLLLDLVKAEATV